MSFSRSAGPFASPLAGEEGGNLSQQLLADRVARAIEAAGVRVVLIVSAQHGDGRTHLMKTLQAVFGAGGTNTWGFFDLAASHASPDGYSDRGVIVIDGPALLDFRETLLDAGDVEVLGSPRASDARALETRGRRLPVADGALIVLRAGRTTEEELAAVRTRLDAFRPKLKVIGVIWNERDRLEAAELFGAVRSRIRRWTRRRSARGAGPTMGRHEPGTSG